MNYAGFWIRVGAYLIDAVVLWIAQFLIYGVFGVSMTALYSLDADAGGIFETTGGLIAYFVTLIGGLLYFVLMDSSAKQGTLGKMAVGLVITDENGNRISPARAVGRYFAKILSVMVFFIGYIMVAFTEKKQGLHDMICSTYVLHGRPGETGFDPNVFD